MGQPEAAEAVKVYMPDVFGADVELVEAFGQKVSDRMMATGREGVIHRLTDKQAGMVTFWTVFRHKLGTEVWTYGVPYEAGSDMRVQESEASFAFSAKRKWRLGKGR